MIYCTVGIIFLNLLIRVLREFKNKSTLYLLYTFNFPNFNTLFYLKFHGPGFSKIGDEIWGGGLKMT